MDCWVHNISFTQQVRMALFVLRQNSISCFYCVVKETLDYFFSHIHQRNKSAI